MLLAIATDRPSPLVGEGAPKDHRIRFANSVGMRGIAAVFIGSSAEERNPSPWIFAERKNPVPLPQGARVGPVDGVTLVVGQ